MTYKCRKGLSTSSVDLEASRSLAWRAASPRFPSVEVYELMRRAARDCSTVIPDSMFGIRALLP